MIDRHFVINILMNIYIYIYIYTLGNIDEDEVMGVMKLFEKTIPKWTALEGYLNLYNYSKALKTVPGCGRDDGIHFEPVCNYQVFTRYNLFLLIHSYIHSLIYRY